MIALKEANCTVCYKCSRECPDWCIYIDAHKEARDRPTRGPRAHGAPRSSTASPSTRALHVLRHLRRGLPLRRAVLEPPQFEYAELRHPTTMTHERERLEEWTYTVLPPGARRGRRGGRVVTGQEYAFLVVATIGSLSAIAVVTARNVVHAALYLVVTLASVGITFLLLGAEFIRMGPDPDLRRRHRDPVPVRSDAHQGPDRAGHAGPPEPGARPGRGPRHVPRSGGTDHRRVPDRGRGGAAAGAGCVRDPRRGPVQRLHPAVRSGLVRAARQL